MKEINEIAKKLDVEIEQYGKYKAKIIKTNSNKNGKLILVTAINPTPKGEGKTTVSIGLADSLQYLGKNVCLALREPSLGPIFGMKGGATGGGLCKIVPSDDINLHFTGDFHAITSASNLLSSAIENHIYQGNNLKFKEVIFKRCVDMNDRSLRNIDCNLNDGIKRKDGFVITAASEIMAILCLSKDLNDLKNRLGNIIVGININNDYIYAKQLNVNNAMTVILKDAIKPNLVQTLFNTPCIIHGGPFANIAHGCNSLIATNIALKSADYVVTEAGFGADLGAEKFFDIKCRIGDLKPDVVVIVATIKALKYHGGSSLEKVDEENIDNLKEGCKNLIKHIENIKNIYKLNVVVALNKFDNDSENEIQTLKNIVDNVIVTDSYNNKFGSVSLASKILELLDKETHFSYAYENNDTLEEKINKVCKNIYGAKEVIYSDKVLEKLNNINYQNLPICIAKTPYSLSDNPKKLNRPIDFNITIKDISLSNGAGFVVVYTNNILTMPGLPKSPNYVNIDIINNDTIGI